MSKPIKFYPPVPHTAEPYDGHDRMVRCADCKKGAVPDWQGNRGCARYVPAMRQMLQHCPSFAGGRR